MLARPVTEKHTMTLESSLVRIGASSMQGWRKNMEDSHMCKIRFEGSPHRCLLGVFDGHNGAHVARFSAVTFPTLLAATPSWELENYGKAFEEAFEELDNAVRGDSTLAHEGGCTAACVLLTSGRVVCANAGDSRAVLYRNNNTVIPLSLDHKPASEVEVARIEQAGATIVPCANGSRVNGILAVSRAIGDFEFKNRPDLSWMAQAVTAKPDITEVAITSEDNFIVIACDGIWEVLSSEEVCKFVSESLAATKDDVGLVCEMLLDRCLAPVAPGPGCDNMTVLIAQPKSLFFE
jgi:protein phosphatase 2C family protein 2/3